jgi:isopentenyl-diphosphate delta-isomerase
VAEMRQIERRKADHIEVAMQEKVWPDHNHWDDVKLIQNALPEVDLDEIDTSVRFLGKKLDLPLVITAITGGYSKAERINANIAEACAELQVGMGVGSQRAGIENSSDTSYTVLRDHDIPLRIGNIGAPQLIKQRRKKAFSMDDVKAAFEMVSADVMAVHLNYLQEVAQPEGDLRAVGCLEGIRAVARELPCMVKETGAGLSEEVAIRLKGTGVVGLDVSGLSGTSFSAVEMHRAKRKGDEDLAAIGQLYSDWGIPAPVSVIQAQVGLPVMASGGVRNGLDLARGIVLGASCGGMARAFLPAALESADKVKDVLIRTKKELKVAMFLTGSADMAALAKKNCVITGPTKEWMDQLET